MNKLKEFQNAELKDFNPEQPFFWKLRLPESKFNVLEKLIETSSILERTEAPLACLAYIAEWYKWKYQDSSLSKRLFNPSGKEIEEMLRKVKIDIDKFIAVNSETNRHSWLYSVFVLGGLPVNQELNNQGSAFLRKLCRLYNAPGYDKYDLDTTERGIAFRNSLKPGGSLYHFIKEIIYNSKPFAEEDLKDRLSKPNLLINGIQDANKAVKKDKFSYDWVFNLPPESEFASRKLRLNILPELTGIGKNQYLNYERVFLWGFSKPKEIERISIVLRFIKDGEEIYSINDIIEYTNTGFENRGFIAWGDKNYIIINEIPTEYFDSINIIAISDTGIEQKIQTIIWENCIQVYRTLESFNQWTSRTFSQRETAVIWGKGYYPCMPFQDNLNREIYFRFGNSIGNSLYNFTYLPESLTLRNHKNEEITFYNHQGYDEISSLIHFESIEYLDGNKVLFVEFDEDGEPSEELLLPLIYSKYDVKVSRSKEEGEENDEIETDVIEWKNVNRYEEWNELYPPPKGRIKIRTMVRGRFLTKEFLYIGGEISRDLKNNSIHYPGGEYKDIIENPGLPLNPAHSIIIPTQSGEAVINVWRPFDCKEINSKNKNWERVCDERVSLPALYLNDLSVAIFNEQGYRKYDCRSLTENFFAQEMHIKVASLLNGTIHPALSFDSLAPHCLDIVMAYPKEEEKYYVEWLEWNYSPESNPHKADIIDDLPTNSVIFQNRENDSDPLNVICPKRGNWNTFKGKKLKNTVSFLECFEILAKFKNYYFTFFPLSDWIDSYEDFKDKILNPLLEKRGGVLSKEDEKEIKRAITELNLKKN